MLNATRQQAEEIARDKQRTSTLLGEAMRKAEKQEGRLQSFWAELQTLFRLMQAWVRGAYREIPWKTVVLILAALLYFVNPMDMIPDAILGIGYLDDATVIAWVIRSLKRDIDRFVEWEKSAQPH